MSRFLVVALLLALTACGIPQTAEQPVPAAPSPTPNPVADPPAPTPASTNLPASAVPTGTLTGTFQAVGSMSPVVIIDLVNVDDPGAVLGGFDRCWVSIRPDTVISEQQSGEQRTITLEEFLQRGEGRRVQVSFDGAIAASAPPGVDARAILLLEQ